MDKILTVYLFNKKQDSSLVVLALVSLCLMLLRVKLTHDIYLLFLLWNLFLGYIPYSLSSKIRTAIPGTFKFYLLFFGWLLFLPNSFYLVTDFVHLHHNSSLQYLFDAILLSCFTIAGFYAGIASLFHINKLLEMKYSTNKSLLLIAVICYLSSYGIYLGRILRCNSWDILSQPVDLFSTVLNSALNPEMYPFTAILGTFILAIYLISFRILNKKIIKSW